MRFGVYARNGHPVALAFAAGLRDAGVRDVARSLPDFGGGCVEQFDAVAVLGLRGKGARIMTEYRAAGVPVVVIDFGYINRTNGTNDAGYWQISLGGLNKIVPFPVSPDRFDSLGVHLAAPKGEGGPTILCAQLPGDAAHPFATHAQLFAWVDSVPHDEVRWHPEMAIDGEREPLGRMLDRAGRIATWNSNVGHDALIAGVPVYADVSAPYIGITMADRAAYFARVAYSQWSVGEMKRGLAQRFLLNHVLTGIAPAVPLASTQVTARRVTRRAA